MDIFAPAIRAIHDAIANNPDRCIAVATLAITAVGAYFAWLSAKFARKTYRLQIMPPSRKVVCTLEGDWPTATITLTNTGDDHLSIDGIAFDVYGDGVTIKTPPIEHKSFDKFPYLLVSRAAVKVSFFAGSIEAIPINVSTRIVLQLSAGSSLTCDGCILGTVDQPCTAGKS